eukprot:3345700-Amphidinium_carterae.1
MDVEGSSTNLASNGLKAQGRDDDHPGSGGRITSHDKGAELPIESLAFAKRVFKRFEEVDKNKGKVKECRRALYNLSSISLSISLQIENPPKNLTPNTPTNTSPPRASCESMMKHGKNVSGELFKRSSLSIFSLISLEFFSSTQWPPNWFSALSRLEVLFLFFSLGGGCNRIYFKKLTEALAQQNSQFPDREWSLNSLLLVTIYEETCRGKGACKTRCRRSTFALAMHMTGWARACGSPCSFAVATLRGRAGTRSPPLVGDGPANPTQQPWLGRPPSRGRGTPCRSR